MPKSLKQVLDQIAKLEKQAEALKAKEIEGVVARIKEAIEHYGLTEKELFGSAATGAAAKPKLRKARVDKAPKKAPSPPKYQDDAGHTWTGVGKRPTWFKLALEAGKTADDLAVKA